MLRSHFFISRDGFSCKWLSTFESKLLYKDLHSHLQTCLEVGPSVSEGQGGGCFSWGFSGKFLSVRGRVPSGSWEWPLVESKSPFPIKDGVGDVEVEVSTRVPSDSSDSESESESCGKVLLCVSEGFGFWSAKLTTKAWVGCYIYTLTPPQH